MSLNDLKGSEGGCENLEHDEGIGSHPLLKTQKQF
jgi:hypothetical protein